MGRGQPIAGWAIPRLMILCSVRMQAVWWTLIWTCKLNKPLSSQHVSCSWCFFSAVAILRQVDTRIVRHCCDDLTVLFREYCGRTLEFGREKLLYVESLVSYSWRDWKIRMWRAVQMMEAWLAKFQREAKSLLGHLGEETIVSGHWSWRISYE